MKFPLVELFFPKICPGCQAEILHQEYIICFECRHKLIETNQHLLPDNAFYKRFYGRLPLEFAASFIYFDKMGISQELMHQLKYKGQSKIANALAKIYCSRLQESDWIKSIDAVIPVPLHPSKLKKRGYNQVDGFGEELQNFFQIPYHTTLLVKTKQSSTQTLKDLFSRNDTFSTSKTLFSLQNTEQFQGKHLLLIDDIVTTGATLEACGKTLLAIPNVRLSILTLCFAH